MSEWFWLSIDEKTKLPTIPKDAKQFFSTFELCLTGDGINYILDSNLSFFNKLLPHIRVFARVAPKQKV